MLKLKERLNGLSNLLTKNQFEAELKNALKRHNFDIAGKTSGSVYEIRCGTAVFSVDINDSKQRYENCRSESELSDIILQIENKCVIESKMVSFTNGQTLLRFLIMRSEEIEKGYISEDFIGGLKKVIVYTSDDNSLNFLDESYLKKWGVPREVLFSVADRNMCRLLERAEINESSLGENVKAVEFILPSKELCVSLIMCNEFKKTVYKNLGSKFLVVAPSRENLLILENVTNNILEGLGTVILNEYRKAKHPLTTDVLLFTPQDIEIIGRFSLQS